MNYLFNNKYKQLFINLLIVLMAANLIVRFTLKFLYYEVYPDSTYFLQMARLFAQKLDIYSNTSAQYNPLAAILLSIPYFFTENPDYSLFLAIQALFIILVGVLSYKILRISEVDFKTSILIALLQVTIIVQLIPGDIVLEPFVLVFILLAILVLQRNFSRKYIYSGMLVFMAFWCKQYALFAVAAFSIYIFLSKEKPLNVRVKRFFRFISGFISLLGLSVIFLMLTSKMSIADIVRLYLGIIDDDIKPTGLNYSIRIVVIQIIKIFAMYSPFIVLIIFNVKKKTILQKDNNIILLLFSLFFFSFSQYLFAAYDHYFALTIPFGLLITIILINNFKENSVRFNILKWTLFAIPIAISLYHTLGFLYSIDKKVFRRDQITLTALKINEVVPRYSKVFVIGDRGLVFWCAFDPPGSKRKLSGFYEAYYPETILSSINSKEYLIVKNEKEEDIKKYYNNYGYILISKVQDYKIYQKK